MIPEGVIEIGGSAFARCSKLASIEIPASLDSIGAFAFQGATAIKEVRVGSLEQWTNITFVNEKSNPLYYGANLIIAGQSAEVIEVPEENTEVKDYAFAGLKTIVEVIIPETIEAIGTGSFTGCDGLKNIDIPETVKKVGEKAFRACAGLASAIIGICLAGFAMVCRPHAIAAAIRLTWMKFDFVFIFGFIRNNM